jgi:hypothetical protein
VVGRGRGAGEDAGLGPGHARQVLYH